MGGTSVLHTNYTGPAIQGTCPGGCLSVSHTNYTNTGNLPWVAPLHYTQTTPVLQDMGTSPGRLPLISMHNVRNLVWGGGGLCLLCRLTSCNLQLIFFLFSDDVPVENLKVCFMCKKIANKKWRKKSGVFCCMRRHMFCALCT